MPSAPRLLALLAAVAGLAASTAEADFLARNGMRAAGHPGKPGIFEVYQRAPAGPTDYWCAAGEYVRYGARQHNTTDIYVVRGLGPGLVRPGRKAVIFSFVRYEEIPAMSDAEKGYSVSISRPGYNLSAGHSSAFCQQSVRRFRRFGLW